MEFEYKHFLTHSQDQIVNELQVSLLITFLDKEDYYSIVAMQLTKKSEFQVLECFLMQLEPLPPLELLFQQFLLHILLE